MSAILRFGAEELFKEDRNDEESKKRLLSMDIDEILERAEKVEEKEAGEEAGNELLSAFKARGKKNSLCMKFDCPLFPILVLFLYCGVEEVGVWWSVCITFAKALCLCPELTSCYLGNLQVANFCSAEDDGSFWSRWIKPEAVAQAEVWTSG